ncbi:MAG: hypothetical protein ACTH1W_08420 [Advenella sp.]
MYMRKLTTTEAAEEIARYQQDNPDTARVLDPFVTFFETASRGVSRG